MSIFGQQFRSPEAGFSLVEILLSVALFALIATGFAGAYFYGKQAVAVSGWRSQATLFAQEGLAAVRNIRDEDYDDLSVGTHGLQTKGGEFELTESPDVRGPMTREITISDAGDDRLQITSQVSWDDTVGRSGTTTVSTRLTRWQETI